MDRTKDPSHEDVLNPDRRPLLSPDLQVRPSFVLFLAIEPSFLSTTIYVKKVRGTTRSERRDIRL